MRSGERVLVTGATGFTGSHLCRRLVREGTRVLAVVRPTSDVAFLERLGVEHRVADLRNAAELRGLLRNVDRVYHLAAAFRQEHADRAEFRRVNVEATGCLLDAAAACRIRRFLHCSTVGVQGDIERPPATEEYRTAPGDHYQRSKLEGERLALEAARDGLAVTVVRPAGIYGPGDTRFLKLFRAIARRRFVMIGSGRTLYHLTFVEDLVDGMRLAATRPEGAGEVFTLAGPRYTTLQELVETIARAIGVRAPSFRIPYPPVYAAAWTCERICRAVGIAPPLYPRRVEFFVKDRAFDISKARRLLGYDPRVDLEEGVRRTAAWYREQGLL